MATPRVLIVDDEHPLARILSFALDNEGYLVEVASDGIDCMNKVSTFAPELVIMDIMMPKLDGIETIRLLRQNQLHRNMAIVAISAKATDQAKDSAIAAGADIFVKKPFQIALLLAEIDQLLAVRKNS